jgi:hypothetical protein
MNKQTKQEKDKLRKAAIEMENCKELWSELKDWDVTLELKPHQTPS